MQKAFCKRKQQLTRRKPHGIAVLKTSGILHAEMTSTRGAFSLRFPIWLWVHVFQSCRWRLLFSCQVPRQEEVSLNYVVGNQKTNVKEPKKTRMRKNWREKEKNSFKTQVVHEIVITNPELTKVRSTCWWNLCGAWNESAWARLICNNQRLDGVACSSMEFAQLQGMQLSERNLCTTSVCPAITSHCSWKPAEYRLRTKYVEVLSPRAECAYMIGQQTACLCSRDLNLVTVIEWGRGHLTALKSLPQLRSQRNNDFSERNAARLCSERLWKIQGL